MSIRTVLLLGNPLLRVNCARVKHFTTPELRSLIDDLRDTLIDFRGRNGFGRAIAAPQIGTAIRVIVLGADEPLVVINPVITRHSRTMMTLWDDCFSFPDLTVKVRRHLSIEVRFQDAEGKRRHLKARGALAELLQHEIDHLNGILAIDRAIDTKHIVYRSELQRWKTGRRTRGM